MSANYDKLKEKLKEVFQLDQADLDFGIYRIMNTKRDEILRYLDKDLKPQVKSILETLEEGSKEALGEELQKAIEGAKAAEIDPETSPKVKKLREQMKGSVDLDALEKEIFSDLYNFFSRYYEGGDFLSLRRYKEGVYAIPYEGEEVKLHWANNDQYYIKTSEYFTNYSFKLADGKRVHFRLVKAGTEANNNKAQEGKDRRFILSSSEDVRIENEELVIPFEYRPDDGKRSQKVINEATVEALRSDKTATDFAPDLFKEIERASGGNWTALEKHLNDYTAKNEFDYFIHKDLGGFMRRELDFFIKNEILYLDDMIDQKPKDFEKRLAKLKALKTIGHKIIDFLTQLEEFQKKLWLKKKFVVETNWCITLDRVPEELYADIATNDAQCEEWVKLFAIDELDGYGKKLSEQFLKDNPYLVLDTAFFSDAFKAKLLESIGNIDQETNGLLIQSDNFQALNVLYEKYRNQVKHVYIDPPYNTNSTPILYKNSYKHSSWITLIQDRALLSMEFLQRKGVKTVAIDDTEMVHLSMLLEDIAPEHRLTKVTVVHNPKGSITKDFNRVHEYALFLTREDEKECIARTLEENDSPRKMRRWGENSLRTERRLRWKYFQYLSLLFTEIYLDRYFRDRKALREELNAYVKAFNAKATSAQDKIEPFRDGSSGEGWLNKIAYWSATGSGKTLLMHINILQYQHYLQKSGQHKQLNRIILLTPNEGLSDQHLKEFEKSGLEAELFDKEGSRNLFTGHKIEIIDIHKLAEKMGDKTVAIDAFEGNNLVLVDEGHRGSSGKDWMAKRNALCSQGFSFEYSATFGQAVKAANDKKLEQEYAKCILFDYSYKFFYNDGYGKDFSILNFDTDGDFTEAERNIYLTACLLVFYQQLRFYEENREEVRPFNIEKPLCVFVGGSVNAVRIENKRKVSDVIDVLLFLALFIKEDQETIQRIGSLLQGDHGLLVDKRDIFAGAFDYLKSLGQSPDALYTDLKKRLFHSSQGQLSLDYLKGSDGEIALKLGNNEAFGVINVGDASKLKSLCEEEHGDLLNVSDKEFSGSYFRGIDNPQSQINFLIGSKKFTEGWSSWRVSTMGLMNIGKKEGSEIIQLFGRGVRLKGYNFCLKRSDEVIEVKAPEHMKRLETLHIFGVRAGYMEQFNQYLEDEGLKPGGEFEEIVLPALCHFNKQKKLKVIKLKDGMDYKKSGIRPALAPEDNYFAKYPVRLDWYPKIQARLSEGIGQDNETTEKEEHVFEAPHLSFLDFDQLYFDLQEYKAERGLTNLQLPKDQMMTLLLNKPKWYSILIPGAQMEFHNLSSDFMRWQEIATSLLKKYVERFYAMQRSRWEQKHLEYVEMTEDDPNLLKEHIFNVEKSKTDYIKSLRGLKEAINKGQLEEVSYPNLHAFGFKQHMYEPLIHIGKGASDYIKVKPMHLNEGEKQFVLDLRKFYETNEAFFKDKEIYLLRNQSRGTGLGFFDEGGFYPDFILWILYQGKQYISFIDPKGIRNSEGMDDNKLSFYASIKDIEKELTGSDGDIRLNSFIVATTEHQSPWWGRKHEIEEFNIHHVFFQVDQKADYVEKIINQSLVA